MSIIFRETNNILICHQSYIDSVYGQSGYLSGEVDEKRTQKTIKLKPNIFDLNEPFSKPTNVKKDDIRRRKIKKKKKIIENAENAELHKLIQFISNEAKAFLKQCQDSGVLLKATDNCILSNSKSQEFLDFFRNEPTFAKVVDTLRGQNPHHHSIIANISDVDYVLPPKCSFYSRDIRDLNGVEFDEYYNLIVLDPPWWNKYIRRSRDFHKNYSYEMLTNDHIKDMPIENLAKANETLVAIWCTNSPKNIQAILEDFLPKWNLKLLATWYWIKITKYGETICEFNLPLKKQPFEQIFIACHSSSDANMFNHIEDRKIIYSVPSIIHSHKPPLSELLLKDIDTPKCLEFFARYLQPNFTSIGLEVLKLQNINLFEIS